MIEAKGISYSVQIGKGQYKTIVDDIDLKIEKGSITGIIGRNGAGKSSLIKILSGLIVPTQGDILLDGKDISHYSSRELALKRSVLSQEIPVSFGLSVLDILLMGRFPHGNLSLEDYKIVDEVIESLNLNDLLDTSYPSLSGGERQKVQFGRALCQLLPFEEEKNRDKVLFLDEPLSALDLSVQQMILQRISELVRKYKLTVVFVLHDLNYIAKHCSKIYLLEKGRCALEGSSYEVFTEANLLKYFEVDTQILKSEQKYPIMIFN